MNESVIPKGMPITPEMPIPTANHVRGSITADRVRELCLQSGGRAVVFEQREVTGPLNLEGALLEGPVSFTGCDFTDPIILTGARAGKGVCLKGCEIRSLQADHLGVDGDLILENVRSDEGVSLCGARVTGHLRCTSSHVSRPSGKAFSAKGMVVEGSALFDGDFTSLGELVLVSARIGGTLEVTGSLSSERGPALTAKGIRVGTDMLLNASFTGIPDTADPARRATVVLNQAHVTGMIDCRHGKFVAPPDRVAIDAELIEAGTVLLNDDFKAEGEVLLDASTLTGRLLCDQGQFLNPGGIALSVNGVDCPDIRLGHGFTATGRVSLIGARISRELNCTAGVFDNENHLALMGDGLVCDGKVYLNETFRARGEVSLRNARVKTEVNCSGGTFENDGGFALRAGGLACEGNVYLNENFTAVGQAELVDAKVVREFNCKSGKFDSLNAQRLTVEGKFDWRPRAVTNVDLSFADIGMLRDLPASWPVQTCLTGLRVRSFCEQNRFSPAQRIDWLQHAEYAPGMYQQLARNYREKGLASVAKEIAIAGQRDRRERGGLPWPSRAWNRFLELSVGYGYALERPLYIWLVWGLLGSAFFYLAQHNNLMIPVAGWQKGGVSAQVCTTGTGYPCFFPIPYSYELLLPVVNLRQVMFWLPSGATGWGQLLLIHVWLAIAAGWALSIAVAGGISHVLSQRD